MPTATLAVPGMILGETALSFLGIGLRAPVVSWGVLLQETRDPGENDHRDDERPNTKGNSV